MEDSERKKAVELLKEMRSENKTTDDKSVSQETHLNWMYKGPSDLIDREEYLLGKAIDKNFEVLNSGESSDLGRTGEQSNVPKRLLEKTDSLEQVDVAKKILEDPLYAIKQKEMEARKKLLNNPVKLKQIKQMLLERTKQNSSHKLKKKKKLRQKSEQDLDILILKKLGKFTDKEKRKALNKVLKSDLVSDSSDSSSSNRKNKKHKLKKKRSHSSSDENDSSSENSSSEKLSKKKRKKIEINKKKQSRKNEDSSSSSSTSSSSSDYEKTKKSKSTTLNMKHFRKSIDSDSRNSTTNEKIMKTQEKSLRSSENSIVKNKRDLEENNTTNRKSKKMYKDRRNSFSDEERRFKKNYGLNILDGSKPERRKREFPVQKYQKSAAESKTKYVPPPKVKPLSDKEKEEKLREMMENAKLRKEDREKNLANHRKKQTLEEQSKIYDDDFMRRQMSHLTSRGTMADRIKSNINNIQRSKSSMDINFVRK